MQELHSIPSAPHDVVVRDEPWSVLGTETFGRVRLVTLRGTGPGNRGEVRTIVCPFDVVRPATCHTPLRAASRRHVLRVAAEAMAHAAAWDDTWTAAAADIDLRDWQLAPAAAVLRGAMRVLLADRVGLGKTIQALLIVAELTARGLASRVLVLTPPALRAQWAAEMRERFGWAPAIVDQASLAAAVAALPPDVNPWSTAPLIVSSIDLVKRTEARAALDGVPFDALVVDEAHHLTPGTDRGALVADLAARTPWVVLVTATPDSGADGGYEFLARLGATGEPLTVFRRAPSRSVTLPPRRSRLLAIHATAEERALLDGTLRYARVLWHGQSRTAGVGLVGAVIARRAASSAAAARRTIERRLALLGGASRTDEPQAPPLPWDEDDGRDAGLPDAVLSCAGLVDGAAERRWLRTLMRQADAAAGRSSKIDAVRRLLRRTREPMLVFSEYRDVVEQVAAALADLGPVAVLHGGLPMHERHGAVRAFTQGEARVLAATDAAGEGLNLQARCRLVVNMELPWSPARLEQRVGRVDRLGQARRVHALHLVHHGSYEGTVIARLARRRARIDARSNDEAATPGDGSRPEHQRRWRAMARPGGSGAVRTAWYAPRTPSSPRRHLHLLFEVTYRDRLGRAVGRELIGARVERGWAPACTLTRAEVRAVVRAPAMQAWLQQQSDARLRERCAAIHPFALAMHTRLAAMRRALGRRRDEVVWQDSLFDRRAEQRARTARRHHEGLAAHMERHLESARALESVLGAQPVLVAAWIDG